MVGTIRLTEHQASLKPIPYAECIAACLVRDDDPDTTSTGGRNNMKSVKYGMMHKETQEFMGVYNPSEYSRGTFSMDANKRFEEDNVRNIVAFFNTESTKKGSSQYYTETSGHDPDEFVAVAFFRNENAFSKSEEVKQIELPEVVPCKMKQARTFQTTPQKLRDRYFSTELQDALQGLDVEAYVVVPQEGRSVKEGDFIYINHWDAVIGEVKMVSAVPDEWPITDTVYERNGWQFVLVERGTKTLEAKAVVSDIEPVAPAPGL
jgi:hypothetical protein